MGRPKKEVASTESKVTAEVEKVKIFSLRRGDIHLKDGQVLKYQEPLDVSEELAVYLEKSFKGEMRRL